MTVFSSKSKVSLWISNYKGGINTDILQIVNNFYSLVLPPDSSLNSELIAELIVEKALAEGTGAWTTLVSDENARTWANMVCIKYDSREKIKWTRVGKAALPEHLV